MKVNTREKFELDEDLEREFNKKSRPKGKVKMKVSGAGLRRSSSRGVTKIAKVMPAKVNLKFKK